MSEGKKKNILDKIRKYKRELIISLAIGVLANFYNPVYAQRIEKDSELVRSVVKPGKTYEGEDLPPIFMDNKDAFLDFFNPHGIPRIGEENNISLLKNQLPVELSDYINRYGAFLKLSLNPGIKNENPIDMERVKELLGKEGYNAILFSRVENINPDAYIGLTPNESNYIDEFNRKIDYIVTFAKFLDKNKTYNIEILDHDNTKEAREQAVKSAVRNAIMDIFNAAYVDEAITNSIDDSTRFSPQLMDLLGNNRNIRNLSLRFTETGAELRNGQNLIRLDLGLEKIIESYNAQKEQYKKTGEKPEIVQAEKKFTEYVHPSLEGTSVSLNEFSKRLNNLEEEISNFEKNWPDTGVPKEIETFTKRLEGELKNLHKKNYITLSEMNYRDPIDPQKRGYSTALSEIRNGALNFPESDFKKGLVNLVNEYAVIINDIMKKGEIETSVAAVKETQAKIEAERAPELTELINKISQLEKERGRVYIGPLVGWSDGKLSYGATIAGLWEKWGIGLEGYHNGEKDKRDESKHQDIGYGFTGDLTRKITENENQTMIDVYGLRRINDRLWLLFGGGLNFSNEGNSIYERTIVEKNNVKISDKTQSSGYSEKKTYPVFVAGLNGHFNSSTSIDWQLKLFYSKENLGINGSILFDLGKLTRIGQ